MEGEKNTLAAESDDDHNKGRSYDCSFCKRGFTNAQALGGHMNIHRKDKAKAKAKVKVNHKITHQDPLSSSFFHPRIASEDYDHVLGGRHVNYHHVYMPPPNPGLQTGNYEYCFFPIWRPDQNLQDRIDGNLNLTIGAVEEDGEEEVDLELRLGRLF